MLYSIMIFKIIESIKYYIITLLIPGLIACTQTTNEQPIATTNVITVKPLLTNEIIQPFSDNLNKDTLQVTITGETLLSGQVNFQIKNHQGKMIYWDTFPASNLINHTETINSESDKKIVQSHINNFFRADHFSNISQVNPDSFAVEKSIKAAWNELKSTPRSRCFSYQSGKNDITYVAYSKTQQKVIILK
ncbi:hypothetical protein GCM10028805_44820 [Spirosoma harenae]